MQIPNRVYTLADLEKWDKSSPSLAVLGYPIEHSLSPVMHNAGLAKLAESTPVFAEWSYYKFSVRPEELIDSLQLFKEKNFIGLNLTIPHKIEVLPTLASLTPEAQAAGAANTLFIQNEQWCGHNTDGYGLTRAIEENLSVKIAGRPVLLLGAGGAARAAAVAVLQKGCSSLMIGNRSPERLAQLIDQIKVAQSESSQPIISFLFHETPAFPADLIVIQATASGLKTDDQEPIDFSQLTGDVKLFDMIYKPKDPVSVRSARKNGFQAVNGLDMLLYQGVAALETWVGQPVDCVVMRNALHQNL